MSKKSKVSKLRAVFGSQVRRHRSELGITQTELAEAADLSLDTISRLERGSIGPSLGTMAMLAKVLEVPASVLLGGSPLDNDARGHREDHLLAIHELIAGVETEDLPWLTQVIRTTLRR